MDDTAQNQNANPPVVPQPVGSVAKEHGPIGTSEFIKPSGAEIEPVVPDELKEHVEVVSDREKVALSDDHKQVGIHHAKESVPVSTQPQGIVNLPPEAEVLHILKTTSVSDSRHWWAALAEKIYEKLRFMHRVLTK